MNWGLSQWQALPITSILCYNTHNYNTYIVQHLSKREREAIRDRHDIYAFFLLKINHHIYKQAYNCI